MKKENIFTRIAEWLKDKNVGNENLDEKKEQDTNIVDKKDNLLNAVIKSLKSNYAGSRQLDLSDRLLMLWVNDNLFYDSLKSDKFQETLMTAIKDELGIEFRAIKISTGLEPDHTITEIMDNCYLQIQSINNENSVLRAKILSVPGNGSIIGEQFVLDSHEIQQLAGEKYNIGAGRHPRMDDGGHRENHIAIDDNPESEGFDKNRYVSRAHAHISYSEQYGFLLYAEEGGTRAASKRTHIYRGGEKIELDNVLIPEPLQDGDYIVLSKNVHLLFEEV